VGDLQFTTTECGYNVSWRAPFSLDVSPDISYCIYLNDRSSSIPVLRKCNITVTHYVLLSNHTKCSDHIVHIIAVNPAGSSAARQLNLPIKGDLLLFLLLVKLSFVMTILTPPPPPPSSFLHSFGSS